MNFNDYQAAAVTTATPANSAADKIADFYVHPGHTPSMEDMSAILRMHYGVLGMCSEAGEVAGKVKKIMRDDLCCPDEARTAELVSEIGDVLWYIAYICDVMGVEMGEVAERNLFKLRQRADKGTLQGSGDNR